MRINSRILVTVLVLLTILMLGLVPTVGLAATTNVALTKWTPKGKARLSGRTTVTADVITLDGSAGSRKFVVDNRRTKFYCPTSPIPDGDVGPMPPTKRVSRNRFFAQMRTIQHSWRGCKVTWKWARDSKGRRIRLVTKIRFAFLSM